MPEPIAKSPNIPQSQGTSARTQAALGLLSPASLFILVLLMSMVCAASLAMYDRFRHQVVLTVDVDAIMQSNMDQLQAQIKSGNYDMDQLLQTSQRWAKQLGVEVENLSSEYNALILVRPAVVHGSIDMTHVVKQRLNSGG